MSKQSEKLAMSLTDKLLFDSSSDCDNACLINKNIEVFNRLGDIARISTTSSLNLDKNRWRALTLAGLTIVDHGYWSSIRDSVKLLSEVRTDETVALTVKKGCFARKSRKKIMMIPISTTYTKMNAPLLI